MICPGMAAVEPPGPAGLGARCSESLRSLDETCGATWAPQAPAKVLGFGATRVEAIAWEAIAYSLEAISS